MQGREQAVAHWTDVEVTALQTARMLARATGESSVFRAFEAAQEALMADAEASRRLRAFHARQQEIQRDRAWGGADPLQEEALEEDWRRLSLMPSVQAYLRAQEGLTDLLREVAGIISQGIGMDYGAACAPAAGCY